MLIIFFCVAFRQEKQHEKRLEVWSKIESLALQNPQVCVVDESLCSISSILCTVS